MYSENKQALHKQSHDPTHRMGEAIVVSQRLMFVQMTGLDKVSIEESKVKAMYTSSNQAVSLSRSESFQQAVANDIVSVSSLPTSTNPG